MFAMLRHLLSGENQFASGGFLLMIVGSAGVFLRSLPELAWEWLVNQFTMTMSVKDEDAAFVWLQGVVPGAAVLETAAAGGPGHHAAVARRWR